MAQVGRPLKFKSPQELQEQIDAYFKVEGKDYPTITGLALYLDTSRQTLINYEDKDEFFDTIKKAKVRVEAHMERHLYGNSVTGIIFNLKNNFGWKDKTETDITSNGETIGQPNEDLANEFAKFLKKQ